VHLNARAASRFEPCSPNRVREPNAGPSQPVNCGAAGIPGVAPVCLSWGSPFARVGGLLAADAVGEDGLH